MTRPKRPRLYVLYEDWKGNPRSQWRYKSGRPRVPGCRRPNRDLHPPAFRWIVRARSVREAYRHVHQEAWAAFPSAVGVVFDRDTHEGDFPELAPDGGRVWTVENYCVGRESVVLLFKSFRDAERLKRALDGGGCRDGYGPCHGEHRVALRTRSQARTQACNEPTELVDAGTWSLRELRSAWDHEVAAGCGEPWDF